MGYRSDVALAVTDKGRKFINKCIKEATNKQVVKEFFDTALIASHEGQYLYRWDQIKLYDFEETELLEKLIGGYMDEYQYYAVVIGDDLEDTQIHGLLYDNVFDLYVERKLHYVLPDDKKW